MTPADLAELRRLDAEGTPAPWRTADNPTRRALDGVTFVVQGDPAKPRVPDRYIASYVPAADAAFITAARNALPALLDAAERAAQVRDLLATLDADLRAARPEHFSIGLMRGRVNQLRAALDGSTP